MGSTTSNTTVCPEGHLVSGNYPCSEYDSTLLGTLARPPKR